MENKFTPNFSILVTIISNKPVDCHHFTLLAEVPSRGALRLGLADQASRRSAFCPPGCKVLRSSGHTLTVLASWVPMDGLGLRWLPAPLSQS